jgi:hypothetical protein
MKQHGGMVIRARHLFSKTTYCVVREKSHTFGCWQRVLTVCIIAQVVSFQGKHFEVKVEAESFFFQFAIQKFKD